MVTTESQEHEFRPIEVIVKDPGAPVSPALMFVQHTPTAA